MQRLTILSALILAGPLSTASIGDPVHHSFSVTVVSVDPGITEIVPTDFFEIAYTIDESVTDQNPSVGAGRFPALATAFSLAARPLNAGTWHPMGTFNVAGGNYVTNAFGENFTFQVNGAGFPNGGPGLTFFDLRLNWTWPNGITDSGLNDQFVQQFGGGTFNPARAVMRASSIRFSAGGSDFREATILPETPALAGDYNSNGVVDAGDYVVWRDLPSGPGILANDTTPGTISSADYNVWRAHFGLSAGSAAGTPGFASAGSETPTSTNAVPEPASLFLMIVALCGLATRRDERREPSSCSGRL